MSMYPVYEDALAHSRLGSSKLPFVISQQTMRKNYPLHHHSFAELSLVLEGSGTDIISGKALSLNRGTVSFLPPHQLHETHVKQGSALVRYCCLFDFELLLSSRHDRFLVEALLGSGGKHSINCQLREEETLEFSKALSEMLAEYQTERFGKEIVIRSKLLETLIFLIRRSGSSEKFEESCKVMTHPGNKIPEILHFLHQNHQEEITLARLSEQFGLNASSISRMFKQQLGQSFVNYLHALRVERAASLLVTTSMGVSEITAEVGFESCRTFSRVFKELKGVSPNHYRKTKTQLRLV